MHRYSFCINCVLLVLWVGCRNPQQISDPVVSMQVIDVGQGTAVLIEQGGVAMAFDLGPGAAMAKWSQAYRSAGSPQLAQVVITHRDEDHSGGLRALDSTVSWSGHLVLSQRESPDSLLRRIPSWQAVQSRQISEGDTLGGLPGVSVLCLWPPLDSSATDPISGAELINHLSLCLLVRYGSTSVLITGDLDSAAQTTIAQKHGWGLKSDIFIVPHHGSADAVCPLFWGYARPGTAVISCGRNSYGHPDPTCIDLLFVLGSSIHNTDFDGTAVGHSNGYYWQWEGAR